jgi:sialic acid synthase SpsE
VDEIVKKIRVGKRWVGKGEPVFIVAEVGQNHNGSMEIAKQLIDLAAVSGCDAVKFCKRNLRTEMTREAARAPYTGVHSFGKTYGEHRRFLELSQDQHADLKKYAENQGLTYFASVCDPVSADQMREIGCKLMKVASRDLTNLPLVEHLARMDLPLFISTGMSTWEDIDLAVDIVRGRHENFVLFHVTSQYPTEIENVNLRAMLAMEDRYRCLVGYSGHTVGILMPAIAATLGAVAIEKHITLGRAMKGTDHAGSLEPDGLHRVVRDVRNVAKAMGVPDKKILDGEKEARKKLARSLVTRRKIRKGQTITTKILTVKSPGTGLMPKHMDKVVGKKAARDLPGDHLISLKDVE